jgi:polysaccharide export outer membrane protein
MSNRTNRTLAARALPTLAAGTAVLLAAFAPAVFAHGNHIAQLNVITPSMRPAAVQTAAVPAQPRPLPPMSQPAAIEPPAQQASATSILEAVGTGDTLRITVFRNPDLTTEARVTEQGTITFPLIGDVKVTGLTPQQVGASIADKLRTGRFVVNPEVSVAVAQVNSRQVSVLGNVNKPGRYPIDAANSKLTDFIAAAGGVAGPGSDTVTVVQTRPDGQSFKTDVDLSRMFSEGNLKANMPLQPGDTIYVHKAPVVYVYGEVQKAGAYRLEPHMTVMQAIAMGGGLTVRGTERGVRIHRRDASGNVKKIDVALTDQVQTDDVVFVRESLF